MKKILITSGPTRAPLDAVRFLSNRSTGRFGTLLAKEALRRGRSVTMIYGVGSETPPPHRQLRLIGIETNEDLARMLRKELRRRRYDAVVHAMAVLDFAPSHVRRGKINSRRGERVVKLMPTAKIINKIKQWSPRTFLVGFKLEVGAGSTSASGGGQTAPHRLIRRGRRLLRESRADLVVANQLSAGSDRRHAGYLLAAGGRLLGKVVGKERLARRIISLIP